MEIIRNLTIPPCDNEEFSYEKLITWPFLGIPFIYYILFKNVSFWWLTAIPLIAAFFQFLKFNKPYDDKEIPKFFIFFVFFGIFSGIAWTKLCCGILIDLLT